MFSSSSSSLPLHCRVVSSWLGRALASKRTASNLPLQRQVRYKGHESQAVDTDKQQVLTHRTPWNLQPANAQYSKQGMIHQTTQASVADAHKQKLQEQPFPKIITSMDNFVEQVPWIVNERKEKNIVPGSPDDPVIKLFR